MNGTSTIIDIQLLSTLSTISAKLERNETDARMAFRLSTYNWYPFSYMAINHFPSVANTMS